MSVICCDCLFLSCLLNHVLSVIVLEKLNSYGVQEKKQKCQVSLDCDQYLWVFELHQIFILAQEWKISCQKPSGKNVQVQLSKNLCDLNQAHG